MPYQHDLVTEPSFWTLVVVNLPPSRHFEPSPFKAPQSRSPAQALRSPHPIDPPFSLSTAPRLISTSAGRGPHEPISPQGKRPRSALPDRKAPHPAGAKAFTLDGRRPSSIRSDPGREKGAFRSDLQGTVGIASPTETRQPEWRGSQRPSRKRLEPCTSSLIGFPETAASGWALPSTSVPVTFEFAKEVDSYMAMEIFRNYSGIEDIHKELEAAVAAP